MSFETNEILQKLPKHLSDFIIDQPFNEYTHRDHSVWRYVMRQNVRFLGKVAHGSYLEGLKQTGISIDTIPHMYGMNRILKEIGWAAVAVDGFIPPQAFMEFQAYKVLVIAADIRNLEHIKYTPAPDILHEAAGHAPIIADPEYAEYLRRFGVVGSKAFSSKKDYELYEAIRHLSIIKENPSTGEADIKEAEAHIEHLSKNMGKPSEMALLRNLHWWTVEYGLIGTPDDIKIYGAGLLSSIGESKECIKDSVKKLPYTLEAQHQDFDITTMQPQLYVTPDFKHLNKVLDEFEATMAYSKGGAYALEIAIESENVATVEIDNSIQISGTVESFKSYKGEPCFVKFSSPTQLCFSNAELKGHGKDFHAHGYSTPIGIPSSINGVGFAGIDFSDLVSKSVVMKYQCGIEIEGTLVQVLDVGETKLLKFQNAKATNGEEILFLPEWGDYDIIIGKQVSTAYYGPADPEAYGWGFESPKEKTQKINYSEAQKQIHSFYGELKLFRDNNTVDLDCLSEIYSKVHQQEPNEWLLFLEIYELLVMDESTEATQLKDSVHKHLIQLKEHSREFNELISDGLDAAKNESLVTEQ